MKRYIKIWALIMLTALLASSCEDYLDINKNPNQPTSASPQLVLPMAIVESAGTANIFNSYGGHYGGMIANAGGFSGFGNLLNYNLTPGDHDNLWITAYLDPLKDLDYVLKETEGNEQLAYFNAAAKIMTVVNFQRLVDAFGDIPYTDAFKAEAGNTAPKYDDAADIYEDFLVKLDEAIATIDDAQFPLRLTKASDPLFGAAPTAAERPIAEQMRDWQRYANTLKLRILIRLSGTRDVTADFADLDLTLGFLTDDAIIDPGYEKNKPNLAWATWGRNINDGLANPSRIPTTYSFGFFGGAKILDDGRGETIFVNFPTTPTNQLGNEVNNPTIVAGQVTWGSNQDGLSGTGIMKGPGMGYPLMLLAESKFLVAEAQLKGFLPGDFVESYYEGIRASFVYLYKDENEAMVTPPTTNPNKPVTIDSLVEAYIADNVTNDLVNIELASVDTEAERMEAIITQKYIALYMIAADEAWNEYRRTGFPATVPGGAPALDIASNKSTVTNRVDRLPTRIMYPTSEQSYNTQHYREIDFTTELIFWDPN